jgi:hypothetical protein
VKRGSSSGRVSATKHVLNALDNVVMFEQITMSGGSAPCFYSGEEVFFVLKHAVNRLLNHLCGILPGAGGKLPEAGFLFGERCTSVPLV